ncbi:MAG: permease-like cell division protein FtsX [Oscillospiraceae bacterium]|nr:permease-like cell division protein FtsX [Oscillospiraceae bacterium]
MSRFFYLLWQGVKNIFTHGIMSFASVAVITACLVIMGALSLITWNINAMINEMQNQNKVIAYIDENLSEEDARALQSQIDAVVNTESVEFVTREEAMENFESDYDDTLFETIDSSVFRHRYVITLDDISQMKDTQAALQAIDGVADVNAHLDYAQKFITFRNIVSIVSIVLVGVMLLVSLFIMTNTIKLGAFTRKDEIAIMKIVGATNRFIRFPFVIEGLLLGAVGGGLAYLIVGGLYTVAKRRLMTTMIAGLFTMVPLHTVMLPMLVAFFGIGILVGVIGGVSAIRSYLKV